MLSELAPWQRWFLGLTVLAGIAGIVWAGIVSDRDPGRWLLMVGALLALGALLATTLAAFFTWPPFHEWVQARTRVPDISLWLEYAPHQGQVPKRMGDDGQIIVATDQSTVIVKVVVQNGDPADEHTGVLRDAILNVAVPARDCDLRPLDPIEKIHYRATLPSENDAVLAKWYGLPRAAALFTVGRGDISPGHHVFHVEVFVPLTPGRWPLKVELSGNPQPRRERSVLVAEIWRAFH
jgi:hypothetical protein